MSAQPSETVHISEDVEEIDLLPSAREMTPEEARDIFDRNARFYMDMSGEEFERKWHAGEFGDVDRHPDHLKLMEVALLLPLMTKQRT